MLQFGLHRRSGESGSKSTAEVGCDLVLLGCDLGSVCVFLESLGSVRVIWVAIRRSGESDFLDLL